MKIGFLPFYVDYYEGVCPDYPREKAEVARLCAAQLARQGEVLWDQTLIRDAASAAARGQALAGEQPDCVVVVTTIAVFGGIPWAALQHLDVPILLWNAQLIEGVPARYDMVDVVRNTGQIGTQALSNTLLRNGRRFSVVTGYHQSPRTHEDLARFFRIVGTAAAVRRAKLLDIGGPFPQMTDIELDDAYLAEHLGPTVRHVDAAALTHRYAGINERAVQAHVEDLRQHHAVEAIDADALARSARLCEAVTALAEETGADAGTVNCHGPNCLKNPAIGITACYALGVQNRLGRPFTCTGDLPTALAMLMLKRLTGTAMYTEIQVMDERRQAVVIANSGEGEDTMRRHDARSTIRGCTNFAGVHGRGAAFAYPLEPGPVTIASLTPTPNVGGTGSPVTHAHPAPTRGASPTANREAPGTPSDKSQIPNPKSQILHPFRLVIAQGHILDEPLPEVGALAGFFQFAGVDLHTGYRRWLEAGPVHHAATAPGHRAAELREVCALLNIEYLEVC